MDMHAVQSRLRFACRLKSRQLTPSTCPPRPSSSHPRPPTRYSSLTSVSKSERCCSEVSASASQRTGMKLNHLYFHCLAWLSSVGTCIAGRVEG
eukprot:1871801-Rhodomonas_salina.1